MKEFSSQFISFAVAILGAMSFLYLSSVDILCLQCSRGFLPMSVHQPAAAMVKVLTAIVNISCKFKFLS